MRDNTRGYAPDGLARGSASPALPIPNSVFRFVGEVSVRRPEFFCDFGIILRSRIFIANENADRRAERLAIEDAGKNLATIFLLPLRGDFALIGPASIELALNVDLRDLDLWWATIDHNADAAAVRLTERRDAKKSTEAVAH